MIVLQLLWLQLQLFFWLLLLLTVLTLWGCSRPMLKRDLGIMGIVCGPKMSRSALEPVWVIAGRHV